MLTSLFFLWVWHIPLYLRLFVLLLPLYYFSLPPQIYLFFRLIVSVKTLSFISITAPKSSRISSPINNSHGSPSTTSNSNVYVCPSITLAVAIILCYVTTVCPDATSKRTGFSSDSLTPPNSLAVQSQEISVKRLMLYREHLGSFSHL